VPRCYAATLSQRGISLIELIMFIVIVSVALAGILLVMNVTTKSSADPLVHKQALAIAESLIEEVELMPFTFCDPDDANAASAVVPAIAANGCASMVENIGVENDLSRYDTTFPWDNVSDYNIYNSATDGGIKDITGNPIGPVTGYTASIAVANTALVSVPATESLLITVTVTGPDNVAVVLQGYRTRYSPRSVP